MSSRDRRQDCEHAFDRCGLRIMCAVNAALAGTEAGQLLLAHDPAGQPTLPPGEHPE